VRWYDCIDRSAVFLLDVGFAHVLFLRHKRFATTAQSEMEV
jgi:hypothetical protein